jgi:3',5'-cyclic-AMP phosphodiesterase
MTRVLQLSDTHLVPEGELAYGVVDTGAYLARAVASLSALLDRIGPVDYLVVSGDVAEAGLEAEYRRFAALMEGLSLPLAVVPGNHDDRETMRSTLSALPDMPRQGQINWQIPLERFDVLGLDTLVRGKPHGELTDETLAFAEAALAASAGKPLLVVMHHPPFEAGIFHMDRQRLLNGEALLEMIADYPGHITVSCGHVHRFMVRSAGRQLAMIAPAPSHAVTLDHRADAIPAFHLEPPGALLHEWRGQGASAGLLSQFVPLGEFAGPHPFFP